METVSPSQLRPAVIQRISTSGTAGVDLASPIESTNSRQLVAGKHGHNPFAADCGSQGDESRMLCDHVADNRGPAAQWVRTHCGKQSFRLGRGAYGHEPALACNIQGIET